MMFMFLYWVVSAFLLLPSHPLVNARVSITILHDAVFSGAVCLDGTPPAYYHIPGFGEGASSWLLFLSGGAWCVTDTDCLYRARDKVTGLGSSNYMAREMNKTDGIFSSSPEINPYFYNWNKAIVAYCDGASFSADVQAVNPATNLTYRGARIFSYVVEDLKAKGMNYADNALLAGQSAGGLAAMLKCDEFRALLPNVPRVKCLSDAGYFVRSNTTLLPSIQESYFGMLIRYHQLAGLLPKSCTSKMNPELCVFPQYFVGDMQTPLFLIESQFDAFQMAYRIVPNDTDWIPCIKGEKPCKLRLVNFIKEFRKEFVAALPPKQDGSLSRGFYVDSCFVHGQSVFSFYWNELSNLKNKTISKVVGDWYFDISPFQEIEDIDQPYNCTG